MTSLGIGLCSRQVPPREDADLQQLGAAVAENEEGEELGHREASVPPAYFEFEDAILFAKLDSMDNMLSAGGQLKFTGDPGGPRLTHLRQSWAATEVDLKFKPATVGLTDNDRFHLLVRLTGGGAREQLWACFKRRSSRRLTWLATSLCSVSTNELYSLINGSWQLMRPSLRRSKLQKNNQNLPQSLFFLTVHSTWSRTVLETVRGPLSRKVNGSDFKVSGFSNEARRKHG
jgi:hypothetical protein